MALTVSALKAFSAVGGPVRTALKVFGVFSGWSVRPIAALKAFNAVGRWLGHL